MVSLPAFVLVLAAWIIPSASFGQTCGRTCAGGGRGCHRSAGVDREPRAVCTVVSAGGRQTLTSDPERDPYTKFEWDIRLGSVALPRGGRVTLELQFFDQGAGLIDPRLQFGDVAAASWVAASRRSSYTRLNTLTERRAWFEFVVPAKCRRLIGGPAAARRDATPAGGATAPEASAEDWAALKASVPKRVTPMVKLERPMELVTTAGVDVVGDRNTLEQSLDAMNDLAPLARVLGFTSIESYVTWKRLEPEREGSSTSLSTTRL